MTDHANLVYSYLVSIQECDNMSARQVSWYCEKKKKKNSDQSSESLCRSNKFTPLPWLTR